MPSNLDLLQESQARTADTQLGDAMHNAGWANTFHGEQSPDALRATRNVTELANNALDMKMRLAAQTDKNAQEIYQKGEQFKQWQDDTPLRDELLRSKIAAEGATARFQAQKELDTLNDTSSVMQKMINAPPPGDPAHAGFVLKTLADHPHFTTTQAGRVMLNGIAGTHDTAAALNTAASEYYSPEALQKDNPGAKYRQNPKTGGFIVTQGEASSSDSAEPAAQYNTPAALLAENPNSKYKQDPKTGGYYVSSGGSTKSEEPASQYATSSALLAENPGAEYRQDPKTGGYYVFIGGKASNAPAGRVAKPDDPAKELERLHKITPTELLNPVDVKYGEWKGEGKNAKFIPDAGGKTGGRVAQIDVGRDAMVHMSASEYTRYQQALGGTAAPATTAATPANRKSLDDIFK